MQFSFVALSTAKAEEAAPPSEKILAALKVKGSKNGREGVFDDVIKGLIRNGYLRKRYDAKEDYSERWKVLKPLEVFGNRVLVISNERQGKYIGCCIDDRAEILMAATGDVNKLRDFAKANACRVSGDEPTAQRELKEALTALKVKTDATKFVEMRCGAGDVLEMK